MNSSTFSNNRFNKHNGVALLLVLFAMGMVSVALLGVLNVVTSQLTARRNSENYERALYLAGAGVHSALAELEIDSSYSTDIPETTLSTNNTFSATIQDQGDGTILVTGIGNAGNVTRRLQVTIDFGG